MPVFIKPQITVKSKRIRHFCGNAGNRSTHPVRPLGLIVTGEWDDWRSGRSSDDASAREMFDKRRKHA